MKNLLVLCLVGICGALQAQFRKGDVFMEGSAGLTRVSTLPTVSVRLATVNPSIGFMISERTAVFAGMGWQRNKTELPGFRDVTVSFSAFGGVRRFFPLSDKVYFFVQGLAGYGENVQDMFGTTGSSGDERFYLQVSPGFVFFPHPRWALTTRIGSVSYAFGGAGTQSDLLFEAGTLRLGLLFRFNK